MHRCKPIKHLKCQYSATSSNGATQSFSAKQGEFGTAIESEFFHQKTNHNEPQRTLAFLFDWLLKKIGGRGGGAG